MAVRRTELLFRYLPFQAPGRFLNREWIRINVNTWHEYMANLREEEIFFRHDLQDGQDSLMAIPLHEKTL